MKELPINYIRIAGKPVIYSGGGYFRLFPYHLINRWTRKQDYVMSYLHPRDFDPDQPMIKDLPSSRKFKSYVGLKTAERKFLKWTKDFHFMDIYEANEKINWEKVPHVTL
jgi:peptidoglycan-N-acetylglucosamine deacetylase